MAADSAIQRALAAAGEDSLTLRIRELSIRSDAFAVVGESFERSIRETADRAARLLQEEQGFSSRLADLMKSVAQRHSDWIVPRVLVESVGPLKALEERLGQLTLPVIEAATATAISRLLGEAGLRAQLADLGIGATPPSATAEGEAPLGPPVAPEQGIGLSRRTMDLATLLSLILAILIPILQELSSREWQASADAAAERHRAQLQAQADQIAALSALVEKALLEEAKRREARLIVRERTAVVRRDPRHGAPEVGRAFSRQEVRYVSQRGKWIEIEFYHWLARRYETGWVLKKYVERVAVNNAPSAAAELE